MKKQSPHRIVLFVLMALILGTINMFAQAPCIKGTNYLKCEDCQVGGNNIPWGPTQSFTIPYMLRGGTPTCSLQVCVKKRMCNGEPQMKIIGVKTVGCLVPINNPIMIAQQVLQYAMMQAFIDNSYGLFPNYVNMDPTTWYPVTIYMHCCYGKYNGPSGPTIYFIPCSKTACCVRKFKVTKTDCGLIGSSWDEQCHSDEYGQPEGIAKCGICVYGANTLYAEMVTEADEVRSCLGATVAMFDKNTDAEANTCSYVCPSDWTGDFTVVDGVLTYTRLGIP